MLHIRNVLRLSLPYLFRRPLCTKVITKKELILSIIKKQSFNKAISLLENNRISIEELIEELTATRNLTWATKLINQYDLTPEQFPDLLWAFKKNFVSFLYHNEPWIKVEEMLENHKDLLGYFAEKLVKAGEMDIALSIIHRYNLLEGKYITAVDVIEILNEYLETTPYKDLKPMDNLLLKIDNYAPTEEMLNESPIGTFWSLQDFELDPTRDVIWIDDVQGENFRRAREELLESDVVGVDSEYKLTLTPFEKAGTSILQLATWKHVYIFDVEKLCNMKEYGELVKEIFENKDILKVGHTLTGDVDLLRKDSPYTADLEIKNHVDIATLYKKTELFSLKSNLSQVCEDVLGKPISKFEQRSNWSRRPLRKSQIHYAALDAYIVLEAHMKLMDIPKKTCNPRK